MTVPLCAGMSYESVVVFEWSEEKISRWSRSTDYTVTFSVWL